MKLATKHFFLFICVVCLFFVSLFSSRNVLASIKQIKSEVSVLEQLIDEQNRTEGTSGSCQTVAGNDSQGGEGSKNVDEDVNNLKSQYETEKKSLNERITILEENLAIASQIQEKLMKQQTILESSGMNIQKILQDYERAQENKGGEKSDLELMKQFEEKIKLKEAEAEEMKMKEIERKMKEAEEEEIRKKEEEIRKKEEEERRKKEEEERLLREKEEEEKKSAAMKVKFDLFKELMKDSGLDLTEDQLLEKFLSTVGKSFASSSSKTSSSPSSSTNLSSPTPPPTRPPTSTLSPLEGYNGHLSLPDLGGIVFDFIDKRDYDPTVDYQFFYKNVVDKPRLNGKSVENVKFAIVKQDVYTNLYCTGSTNDGKELISKTLKHQGPLGFFTSRHKSYFYVIETDINNEETSTWKEKVTDCKFGDSPQSIFEKRSNYLSPVNPSLFCDHTQFSVKEDSVDWSRFDIVISMDTPFTKSLMRRYPNVVWAYYITEGCMKSYKASYENPIDGYDLYLTQNYNMRTPKTLKPHVIEFPYAFAFSESYQDILGEAPISNHRRMGILLCRGHELSSQQVSYLQRLVGNVAVASGTPEQLREKFMFTKYFIYFKSSNIKSRGNAAAEAIAAGTLVISGYNFVNRDLIRLSNTLVSTSDEVISLVESLESDPLKFKRTLDGQKMIFNFLVYDRPLYQILERANEVLKNRDKN